MSDMNKAKRGLGRGLDTLLPPKPEMTVESTSCYREVDISSIVPGRLQPRSMFDEEQISSLSLSIEQIGILEPLVVTPLKDGRYELIAGERRYRASNKIGLQKVPVVIKDVDSENMLLMSLVENIQRQDLNSIEEAKAYKILMEQFSYTQEEVAKKLGKSRSSVANTLRLLDLPELFQEDIILGKYSAGHARALLVIENEAEREKLRQDLINGVSVRTAEETARTKSKKKGKSKREINLDPLTSALRNSLGTKVVIKRGESGKGKIAIEFYSDEELDRLTKILLKGEDNESNEAWKSELSWGN